MPLDLPLPKFRQPPVIEVAHGVQFPRLPMNVTHPGRFYLRIKDMYPQVRTVAPLPPVREFFDGSASGLMPQFQFMDPAELPRAWFISEDDIMLVQLQADRLLLNWRKKPEGGDYPHFETVTTEFQRIYKALEAFAADCDLGPIDPDQSEMTYVNHLPLAPPGEPMARPEDYIRCLISDLGDDWPRRPDELGLVLRYVMRKAGAAPYGRLHVNLDEMTRIDTGEKLMKLELTARGSTGARGIDGVAEFHRAAHEAIVRCFAGLTTPAAHDIWERLP